MRFSGLPRLSAMVFIYTIVACAHASSSAVSPGDRHLLLEVWINGQNQHVIAHVAERDGRLWIDRKALAGYGIRLNSGDPDTRREVEPNALSGIRAVIDEAQQRLLISADSARLYPKVFDLNEPAVTPSAVSGSGFVFNYDAVATSGDGYGPISGGGTLVATAFTPNGRLTTSGFAMAGKGHTHAVRLDTALVFDEPDKLKQWVVGDSVSGGLSWSRSVRFAGLHVATDYSLQPQFRTFPLPQFIGTSTVPAGVDVYIGSSKVLQENLVPGPFEIHNLPMLTGRGEATVVVRDVLGREQIQTIPFFASNQLLQPGLSAYSIDAGFLRRAYGLSSFDYGVPAAVATFKHGVSDTLTIETHGELAGNIALAGGGATFAIQPLGTVQLAGAASSGRRGAGGLLSVAVTGQVRSVSLFGSAEVASPKYTDVGSIYDLPPPRMRAQAGISTAMGDRGNLAFSWIAVKELGYTTRLLSATYSRSFGYGAFFGATGLYSPGSHSWQGQIFISIPLGDQRMGSVSVGEQNGRLAEQISLNRPANPDGGFGYRVGSINADNRITEGQVTWVGQHGITDAALSSINGSTAGRLGVSGAIIIADGSVFATRQTGDAFALVRTGQPGVPVYRENREVAVADSGGKALVTGLSAYADNRISIDPRDYPMDTIIEHTSRDVVPRRASGVLVDLAPTVRHPLLMTVTLSDGSFPPVGARVLLDGNAVPLVVGRRGKVFFSDAQKSLSGTIEFGDTICRFHANKPAPLSDNAIPTIGPIICSAGGNHAN